MMTIMGAFRIHSVGVMIEKFRRSRVLRQPIRGGEKHSSGNFQPEQKSRLPRILGN
jgi:hypothetical protein